MPKRDKFKKQKHQPSIASIFTDSSSAISSKVSPSEPTGVEQEQYPGVKSSTSSTSMSAPVVTDLSGHKEDNTMILLLVTEEKKEDVTLVTLQKDHLKATIKQAASKRRRQKLVSS